MPTYYMAPQTGNNANSGLDPALPRQDPPTAVNNDVWLFRRGETYVRVTQLSTGSATNMTLGAYGTGPDPVITLNAPNTFALNVQGDGLHRFENIWFKDCTTNTNGGVVGLGIVTGPGYAASANFFRCKFTGCNWNAIRGGGTTTATASRQIKILECEFDDIGEDCFFGPALNLEVGFCRMTRISSRTTTGDAIGFLFADPTVVWVHDNYIDHSTVDSKHCVIVDTTTGAGIAIIERNVMIGFGNAATQSVDHTIVNTNCLAFVRGNRLTSAGVAMNLAGANSVVSGNVVEMFNVRTSADTVIALQANGVRVVNNTLIGRSTLIPSAKVVTQAAAAASGVVVNNVFSNVPIAIKSDNAANNPTATNNAFHVVTSPRLNQLNAPFAGDSDVTLANLDALQADYSLRIPLGTTKATVGAANVLSLAGRYVQGVSLANGRMRPGWCPVGAYQAVLPKIVRPV